MKQAYAQANTKQSNLLEHKIIQQQMLTKYTSIEPFYESIRYDMLCLQLNKTFSKK